LARRPEQELSVEEEENEEGDRGKKNGVSPAGPSEDLQAQQLLAVYVEEAIQGVRNVSPRAYKLLQSALARGAHVDRGEPV
jgi:hypothetical protein